MKAAKAFLESPNLTFLDVNDAVIWLAYNLAEKYRIDPRDALNLACALNHEVFTLISEDKDFGKGVFLSYSGSSSFANSLRRRS
ncbi:MAG: PIN domain-containing protein [Candidatus Bathyarchaeota archaeon]|nr:PIN domain-containing protein [Candidatus Bathyarchaeota archaeon]